jgi:DNA-binding LytR/AlgR family response regulator
MKIMIVEDEALLALELEYEIEASGHEVVGIAADKAAALELLAATEPAFAFIDIHLNDGPTGIEIGRRLQEIGTPYVFVTGNVKRIPDDFAGALGAIEKPYSMNGLQNALDYISEVVAGNAASQPPPSLVPAPA